MRLVIDSEDNHGIIYEATCELGPEFLELLCGGRIGVRGVSNDLSQRIRIDRKGEREETHATTVRL